MQNLGTILGHLAGMWEAKLESDLDGQINVCVYFDEDQGPLFECHGECRKVHPDLVEMYPNGWGFAQNYTLDVVMEKLGFQLVLEPLNVPHKD